MTKKIHVIYHDPCLDGFASAFAAYLRHGEDAVYLPASNSEGPPRIERGADVLMADKSYDVDTLIQLRQRAAHLVILDHHESAVERLKGHEADIADEVVFDLGHSGCVLAHQYLFPGVEVPEFFRRIEDQDLWKWKIDRNREFIAGLSALPLTFEAWRTAYEQGVEALIERGEAIIQFRDKLVDDILSGAVFAAQFHTPDGPVIAPALTAPALIRNEVCNTLLRRMPEAPFTALYQDLPDGRRKWSMRSDGEHMNVMGIAMHNGGGGHREAAAFVEAFPGEKVALAGTYQPTPARRQRVGGGGSNGRSRRGLSA